MDDPSAWQRARSFMSRLPAVATVIAAVPVLAAGVKVVFPDDSPSAPLAALSVERIEPDVTVGDWLRRTSDPDDLPSMQRRVVGNDVALSSRLGQETLEAPGTLFYVRASIDRGERTGVMLRWSMYDARTRRRIPGRAFNDVDAARLEAEDDRDRGVIPVWAPMSLDRGPFFVRFELRRRNGTLAIADSKRFRGPR